MTIKSPKIKKAGHLGEFMLFLEGLKCLNGTIAGGLWYLPVLEPGAFARGKHILTFYNMTDKSF